MPTTDLSKIYECAVGIHLDRLRNIELLLLKGHLLLEVAINNAIQVVTKDRSKSKGLSFHKKLQLLESRSPETSLELRKAIGHLHNLNKMRNRLAHEFIFDGGEALGRWSEAVLVDFPGTKVDLTPLTGPV